MPEDLLPQHLAARLLQPERAADGRDQQARIEDRRERDEDDTVRPVGRCRAGDFEREPGLADAADPGQGDQADLRAAAGSR